MFKCQGRALGNLTNIKLCSHKLIWVLLLSHLYSASLQDGNLQHAHVHVHSLHPGNSIVLVFVLVFVVCMDLEVGHGGVFAGFRHHIAAVAHEVVFETVKGGVVWVSRCSAGGCTCMKDGGGRNVLLPAWVTNVYYCLCDNTRSCNTLIVGS